MSEPIFIAQVEQDTFLHQEWLERQVKAAIEKGVTWPCVTVHPDNDRLLIFEGWAEQPEDQGKPRWGQNPLPAPRQTGET